MLRAFRPGDIGPYSAFFERLFPEESRVLLLDGAQMGKALRKALRPEVRFVLALARALGRPLVDLYALEIDGRLAGTTFVFYGRPSADVSNVAVDTPYQRRGHARRLVVAAEAGARRRGCAYVVLDVLEENLPALQLYRTGGYRTVRRYGWYFRDVGPDRPPLPVPGRSPIGEVRPYRRSDAAALLPIAVGRLPETERRIRPPNPHSFRVPPPVTAAFGGATAAWVHAGARGADGFVRAATTDAAASGHLTYPMSGPELDAEGAFALLDRALAWLTERSVRRIVCEIPEDDVVARQRLAARGFVRGFGVERMVKPLAT